VLKLNQQIAHVGVSPRTIWPCNYFRSIPTYVITVPKRHGRTDGRTDGQTDGQTTYCKGPV